MSNIVLKTHSTTKTVGQIALTQGTATKVKAQKGVNYELVDQQTGRAPDHIITKRVGKDLHISLDKDGQSDDLIIEDYYDHGDAALIGLAEDGQYYYYIPDTGEAVDYVTQLVTGDVEGQALGGGAVSTPWWIGATETKAAIWPWLTGGLLAAGAVGIVAASVDGVADSLEKDTTFTPKTTDADITITVADDDVVNKAEADKATVPVAVKVAPKDGETVTDVKVIINNKEHTATKQANGDYVAQVKPADIKADQDKHADAKVTLTKAGKTGTVTDKEAYTVDTDAPAVTATRQDDNSVKGKTEPNTAITDKAGNPITGANGKPIVSDAKGDFTIPANKVPTDNIIGAKDKAGNVGTGNVTPADTTPPKVKGTPTVDDAGTTLTVTFDEPLDAANPPTKESFTVKVGGKAVQPSAVTVEGDKVKLTLPEPAKKGDTVTVSYKDPSAADDAKAVQDKAGNDAASFTDTDVTNSSTVQDKPNSISSVTLSDNLTDETRNAQNYYPNKNTGPYVGNVGNANTANFDTAVSLKSGLTNDKTPTLNFTLDRAVATGESVEVIRHTMVNGHTARSENVTNKVSLKQGSDKSYSLTDSLTDTYGTDYKYTVRVKKGNKVVNEKSHAFRLDTTVESMEITKADFNDKTKSAKISLKSRGNSEVGATVTYKYMADGREVKGSITDRGNKGVYDLNLQGFNRKDARGLTLETVDAAGNVTTQKVNFLRNLFSEYNTEKGVDVTKASIDDNARVGVIMGGATGRQATTTGSNAIKATNGNDTLVVGLEQFGRFGLLNGSVADEGGVANPRTQNINFGAGDDFLLIRGSLQAFERDATIKMGAGNDKVQINDAVEGTIANPKFKLDMGDGDDLLVLKNGVGSTIRSTLLFGDGNDSMFVGGDFNGRKENVDFGNGNNTLNIGRHLINNGSIASQSKITFGKDNDTLVISGDFDNRATTINMGNGDNFVQVGNRIISGSIISGNGNDTYELGSIGRGDRLGETANSMNVKTGAGNDIVTIKGHAFRGGIHLEGGDDTLSLNTIQGSVSNTNTMVFDGGTGHDTLKLTGSKQSYDMDIIRNFETIDMASTQTKQTLSVTGASLKKSTNSNKLYIKAGAEDIVNLGDGNDSKVNLKDGKLTWSKVNSEQQTIDGTVYDAYNLATTDQWVYIQQGTTVV
ncbi:SwmB domain-containing protein [Moraxella catarrhalis]|uniref:Uncharacterized protein n=1 Tax=Moraxella catarrhalis TaxID=480 RepID=A0AB36DNC0_MORCA|nr:SwmB domain-containing protein [Moraxella catarrhalis]OAV25292.1 hypothetical protein AO370_1369 [Moraxella catarrhalis]